MKTTLKLAAVAAVAATLTACGGGGGGSVSASSQPPVGTTDLATGAKDVNGAKWSTIFSTDRRLTGFSQESNLNGKTLAAAHPEVLAAHREGWTGKGVDTLIVDGFNPEGNNVSHGHTVSTVFSRYAPGSQVTTINLDGLAPTDDAYRTYELVAGTNTFSVHDRTAVQNGADKQFKVLNFSFGSNPAATIELQKDFANALVDLSNSNAERSQTFVNGVLVTNTFTMTDATIVKAAGNFSARAETDLANKALYDNSSTNGRLLIVGATNGTSTPTFPKATFASYSNTCGAYCDRFITAGGGDPLSSDQGTSFAAPRVAGYVAIVRQKFDTISGQRAADRMLQTARTDTIIGYNPSIHGVGEASLARALAPSARIR